MVSNLLDSVATIHRTAHDSQASVKYHTNHQSNLPGFYLPKSEHMFRKCWAQFIF